MAAKNLIVSRVLQIIACVTFFTLCATISVIFTPTYIDIPIVWFPTGFATWLFLVYGPKLWVRALVGSLLGVALHVIFYSAAVTNVEHATFLLFFAVFSICFPFLFSLAIRRYFSLGSFNKMGGSSGAFIAGLLFAAIGLAFLLSYFFCIQSGTDLRDILWVFLRVFGAQILGTIVFLPFLFASIQQKQLGQSKENRDHREYLSIIVLVVLILVATAYAWRATSNSLAEKNEERFTALVEESEKSLKNRLASYEDAILGGAGLFYASEVVSRAEWREYVGALDVVNRYPGINGIGYISKVAPQFLAEYTERGRLDGFPSFQPYPEVENNTYYVIEYIEPVEINLQAVGLNIAFEENRKFAAELSAKTGKSAITQRILLVQDAEKTPGFLLLYPVYSKGTDRDAYSLENLMGWVYAPFIGKNFLGDLTASQGTQIGVNIYDGSLADQAQLIYSEAGRLDDPENHRPFFTKVTTFNIMQQDWTVEWVSSKAFEASTVDFQPELILISGTIIAGLFGLMLVTMALRAASIQLEVERQTDEIQRARNGLQAVLDTVVDGIVELSHSGEIINFNPSAEKMFGYEAEELTGRKMKFLLPKNRHKQFDAYLHGNYLNSEADGLSAYGITLSGTRKDGSEFPLELGMNAFDLGDQRRFVASVRDITESVTAKKALELSEKTFRQTMEQAPIGAISVTPDGDLLRVNHAICELLEYSESELLKMGMKHVTHADDRLNQNEDFRSLLRGDVETFVTELRVITKSQKTVWVELNVSLVDDTMGNPDYLIFQVINVTARKEMERLKSEFVATVSHELRTPITSISGSLSLILGGFTSEISPKVNELLTIAQRNCTRLIALVNDLLDMEKLGEDSMHYDIASVELAPILAQVVEENKSYAEQFDVDLLLDPVDQNLAIQVDAWRLNQILSNFISNAVKFSNENGQVHVVVSKQGSTARISVVDNGIGISDEFKSRIFTKFAQADSSSTREKSGTGLGLMICKHLVEQMGGIIGYESKPNIETAFWAEFKLAE